MFQRLVKDDVKALVEHISEVLIPFPEDVKPQKCISEDITEIKRKLNTTVGSQEGIMAFAQVDKKRNQKLCSENNLKLIVDKHNTQLRVANSAAQVEKCNKLQRVKKIRLARKGHMKKAPTKPREKALKQSNHKNKGSSLSKSKESSKIRNHSQPKEVGSTSSNRKNIGHISFEVEIDSRPEIPAFSSQIPDDQGLHHPSQDNIICEGILQSHWIPRKFSKSQKMDIELSSWREEIKYNLYVLDEKYFFFLPKAMKVEFSNKEILCIASFERTCNLDEEICLHETDGQKISAILLSYGTAELTLFEKYVLRSERTRHYATLIEKEAFKKYNLDYEAKYFRAIMTCDQKSRLSKSYSPIFLKCLFGGENKKKHYPFHYHKTLQLNIYLSKTECAKYMAIVTNVGTWVVPNHDRFLGNDGFEKGILLNIEYSNLNLGSYLFLDIWLMSISRGYNICKLYLPSGFSTPGRHRPLMVLHGKSIDPTELGVTKFRNMVDQRESFFLWDGHFERSFVKLLRESALGTAMYQCCQLHPKYERLQTASACRMVLSYCRCILRLKNETKPVEVLVLYLSSLTRDSVIDKLSVWNLKDTFDSFEKEIGSVNLAVVPMQSLNALKVSLVNYLTKNITPMVTLTKHDRSWKLSFGKHDLDMQLNSILEQGIKKGQNCLTNKFSFGSLFKTSCSCQLLIWENQDYGKRDSNFKNIFPELDESDLSHSILKDNQFLKRHEHLLKKSQSLSSCKSQNSKDKNVKPKTLTYGSELHVSSLSLLKCVEIYDGATSSQIKVPTVLMEEQTTLKSILKDKDRSRMDSKKVVSWGDLNEPTSKQTDLKTEKNHTQLPTCLERVDGGTYIKGCSPYGVYTRTTNYHTFKEDSMIKNKTSPKYKTLRLAEQRTDQDKKAFIDQCQVSTSLKKYDLSNVMTKSFSNGTSNATTNDSTHKCEEIIIDKTPSKNKSVRLAKQHACQDKKAYGNQAQLPTSLERDKFGTDVTEYSP